MLKLMRVTAAVLVATLLIGSAEAQNTKAAEQVNKVRGKLEKVFDEGGRAKLELADGRKVQGTIAELGAEEFVLAEDGKAVTLRYEEVKKVGRFGPSRDARKWVAVGMLGGLVGLLFLVANQTR